MTSIFEGRGPPKQGRNSNQNKGQNRVPGRPQPIDPNHFTITSRNIQVGLLLAFQKKFRPRMPTCTCLAQPHEAVPPTLPQGSCGNPSPIGATCKMTTRNPAKKKTPGFSVIKPDVNDGITYQLVSRMSSINKRHQWGLRLVYVVFS